MKESKNQPNEKKDHWFKLIEKWEKSGAKKKVFCDEHHINLSTFSYWRSQYLAEKNQQSSVNTLSLQQVPTLGFIPIHQSEKISGMPRVIQVKLTSGVMLSIPSSIPSNDIINLIKGLSS